MEDTVPKLKNIDAFREAISNLHVSPRAQEVLDKTKLVVLAGIAGGGRNTIIKELVKKYNYCFLVSDTTRPPKLRDGVMEQNGVNYYFRSEEDMLRDIQNGEFIEAELIHNQQVSGTSIREIERALQSGRVAINDFEYLGARNVAMAKPDAYVIGLLPPSYDEWINRLRNRETLHRQEFINRANTAVRVLEHMLSEPYFKLVVNDTVDACVETIHNIVEVGGYTQEMQERGAQVAHEILAQLKEVLAHPDSLPETL